MRHKYLMLRDQEILQKQEINLFFETIPLVLCEIFLTEMWPFCKINGFSRIIKHICHMAFDVGSIMSSKYMFRRSWQNDQTLFVKHFKIACQSTCFIPLAT